jgi:hypothetical protein
MSVPYPLHYYRRELRAIVALPVAERDALVRAFQETGLTPSVAMLTAEVSNRSGKPVSIIEPIVRTFISLAMTRARLDKDVRSFASELVDELRQDKALNDHEKGALDAKFTEQVGAILACERSLRATAKALDISAQSERVVYESRIISDIRPVFPETSDGTAGQPLQAVVLHTLRLECHGEFQHQHFTLTGKDLQELKEVVERALAKEKVLIDLLQGSGLRAQVFADSDKP